MTYGITGNPEKEDLWEPVARLIAFLERMHLSYRLHPVLAEGLRMRGMLSPEKALTHRAHHLAKEVDVVISFGGDGTLLHTAHEIGPLETPILGINIGRLGFLAEVEKEHMEEAIRRLEAGDYRIESRIVLEASIPNGETSIVQWALNEFVIDRTGTTAMIQINMEVDGRYLTTYWADGLIIATPTGSTAYSLSAGGPIIVPEKESVVLTPLAPHTLTMRPIILSAHSVFVARVRPRHAHPYILAGDGNSLTLHKPDLPITIRKAKHSVRLIKFPEQDFFQTLRRKLMWGERVTSLEKPSRPHS